MNSALSFIQSTIQTHQIPSKQSPSSKPNCLQRARQRVTQKIANKYSTCQNYIILSEINRTIMDKQCVLKTTIKDIAFDRQEEKIDTYYHTNQSNDELPQLIEYYRYYSQKTILFSKEYFLLLYQYQQKQKIIEYDRLKVLLNLSDTQKIQTSLNPNKNSDSPNIIPNRSRIGISRNLINRCGSIKHKDLQCSNILDQLSLSKFSTINDHEESLLINRLRNNLSKHIGPSKIKKMSIQELDKHFSFKKETQFFKPFGQSCSQINFINLKSKNNTLKQKKIQREQTSTNTAQQTKQKGMNCRRSVKRNNSCENLIRISVSKLPFDPATCKIKRKKNLSMDNLCTNTSTPYLFEERREVTKFKKAPSKTGDRFKKQKENTLISKATQKFVDTISDLKSKIQKEKQKLIKASSGGLCSSLKRQKTSYTSVSNAYQRFSKKNYQKLREKNVLLH